MEQKFKLTLQACLALLLLLQFQVITAQSNNSDIPFEIMLSIGGDPISEYTVTWRTQVGVTKTIAQIAEATPNPKFEDAIKEVEGSFSENYGDSGDRLAHKVRFTNLEPNTQYSYRVGNDKVWSEWFHFSTAKKVDDKFSFIYLGDFQNDMKSLGSRAIRQAYSHLGNDASFMLFAGDLVNRSTDAHWNEFFYAGSWIYGTIPSAPTAGNHEYLSVDGSKDRVFSKHWGDIFGMPQNAPLSEYQDRTYYFDYQGVRFIGLDSYTLKEDNKDLQTIVDWLDTTLESNPYKWSIVFTHYPVYSCSSGRNNEKFRNILKPILEKHGVDMVLQGHDHTYCRGFNEENITGDVKNPPLYLVSVAGPKMYNLDEEGWSDVRAKDTQLYQNITVDNNTIYYDSYDITGKLFDSFRLEKDENGVNTLIEQ